MNGHQQSKGTWDQNLPLSCFYPSVSSRQERGDELVGEACKCSAKPSPPLCTCFLMSTWLDCADRATHLSVQEVPHQGAGCTPMGHVPP